MTREFFSTRQRSSNFGNESEKHYFQIPRPELVRILGYQRYLSHSDDLDDEVDVFDHICPYDASWISIAQVHLRGPRTSDVDHIHQGLAAQTVANQDDARRARQSLQQGGP